MITLLLSVAVALLVIIAGTLTRILSALHGPEKSIPSGPEHFEQFDPKKESREHFMGKTANLILEERRRDEIWDPKKESYDEFMSRGQRIK
jgi:hypothetical protein